MSSAFQTLKSNAKILNQQTPEPGALEVVFNAQGSDNEAVSSTNDPEPTEDTSKSATESAEGQAEKPELNGSSKEAKSTEQKSSEPTSTPETKKNDEVPISREIASKLRKFKKYEEKYPGAYYYIIFY